MHPQGEREVAEHPRQVNTDEPADRPAETPAGPPTEVPAEQNGRDRTEVLVGRDQQTHVEPAPQATDDSQRTGDDEPAALFGADDTERFRARWAAVQGGFVDDPHGAVRQADELVTEIMQALTARLAERKERLDDRSPREDGEDTESLRQAVRRYRMFFEQLLRA